MIRRNLAKGIAGTAAFYGVLKLAAPWFNNWGSTAAERRMVLPGESWRSGESIATTHAVTINASPADVWPWIVQIGQKRAGFYSYHRLQNLVGSKVPNVDRILPELQNLRRGDNVYLHPKAPPLVVLEVDPERSLVLEGWRFYLQPIGRNKTRLITQTYPLKGVPGVSLIPNFIFRTSFWNFVHFIMERKMLKSIKRYAERAARNKKRAIA